MRYFRKLKIFDEKHKSELIDTFLYHALKDTDFDYYYDYQADHSTKNKYHGNIDFLIYNKKHKIPIIPVIKAKRMQDPLYKDYEDHFNISEAVGTSLWCFNNMMTIDKEITLTRAIITNGNKWQLIEIRKDGGFDKTGIYKADNKFEKIYEDQHC